MEELKSRWKKTSHPAIRYHDGIFKVFEPFIYMGFYIPKDFSWNGVTGWFTSDNMILPSMIHDFLLSKGYARYYCDNKFLKSMKKEKVFYLKRKTFYNIVRMTSNIKNN